MNRSLYFEKTKPWKIKLGRVPGIGVISLFLVLGCTFNKQQADTILFNGKVITVDEKFSVAEAVAISKGKILAVGTNKDLLKLQGDSTKTIDLKGHAVIPGLIEGHAHPIQASQSEYFEKIPDLHTIRDLLEWIHNEARIKKTGEWIIHPKFFITRLRDMRQLTKRELDSVAPDNPVFLNGSFGGMINSKALKLSGMNKLKHAGILRDQATGEPSGFIRGSAFSLLAINKENKIPEQQQLESLKILFHLYNEVGITSVCSGGGTVEELKMVERLMNNGELTVRVFQNILFPFDIKGTMTAMRDSLKRFGYKTGDGNEWVKVGALKVVLDGGVLTGTAYLREGWGEKAKVVYGINDPNYRGELFISKDELIRLITVANETGWKFTAHVTGGGGVDTLLAAYEAVNHSIPINNKRFSIIHGNFYTPDAIRKMATLGIYADMQPAWYYKDTDLLNEVLGKDRIKTFHPYRSMMNAGIIINGGSDHMVKLDPNTSVNPYNPFLAMWSVITRKTDRGTVYNPEEAIFREQALKMYTINNAYASFEEHMKGSIEAGKFADLVVLTDDLLTCAVDSIREIRSLLTIVNGQTVFDAGVIKYSRK
ncbi:MAG: amidohydrolase [Ferruginibacter sp.]